MARLADFLILDRIVSEEQLKSLQEQMKNSATPTRLGKLLIENNYITEEHLVLFFARRYDVTPVDVESFSIKPEVLQSLDRQTCEKYGVLPVLRLGRVLVLAMSDPSNMYVVDDLKFHTGYPVYPVVCGEKQLVRVFRKVYEQEGGVDVADTVLKSAGVEMGIEVSDVAETPSSSIDISHKSTDAPVIRMVHGILLEAVQKGASDIHIEPYEKSFRVRYRIDGSLFEVMHPSLGLKNAVVSRIKVMSQMDIAEKRLPQDGRIKVKIGSGREIDFRVSVIPTLFGEKAVLRLLDKGNLQLDMTKLGFEEDALKWFKKGIYQPYGMVLVTGPTGSGKTTTLYSALSELNRTTENISTAEDPVEFNLAGINQVQMHNDIGLNFSSALRSFLRQDPDIIMVGEIRDLETAEIAVKAALTGHLVLSTLHTNDAPSTVIRLKNMGIEPFLLTASLNTIVAQRLVKKICVDCKKEVKIPKDFLVSAQVPQSVIDQKVFYEGVGCQMCGKTGYKGRIALYEVLNVSERIKDLIQEGADALRLKEAAVSEGMVTLRGAAVRKMSEGLTTLKEVLRVTAGD